MTTDPRQAFEDALMAQRLADRTKPRPKTAASNATVKTFLAILSSYMTQFDQKLEKKQPNAHRLGHYMTALNKAEAKLTPYLDDDSPEAMTKLKAVLHGVVDDSFPPLKKLFKQIDAWVNDKKLPTLGKY
jgi:hypothetical protein